MALLGNYLISGFTTSKITQENKAKFSHILAPSQLTHNIYKMSYLRAIQKIPGDTASEKLRWIRKVTLYQSSSDLEQFPPELLPILNVETAIKEKKHEDITFALKCEDSAIINRAFKAFWFFDGSYKEIVNVRYFFEHLFPYVSVKTRTRIVLTLAHQLSGKDPIFAQEIFTEMVSIYGIQTAYPLIIACNETFAYKIIVEKELVLPVKIVKKIYYINPDLAVRFLKLLRPRPSRLNRTYQNPFAIGIYKYKSLLPKLIKKRLEAFIELFVIHKISPPKITLSNKCAEIFLKKAQQHLILKPQLYIHILPLKKINKDLMEKIFPNLLPRMSDFSKYTMLSYLEHYPCDKQYDLIRKSFMIKYGVNILEETRYVRPDLLQLLPVEERNRMAKIKILEKHNLGENRYKDKVSMELDNLCEQKFSSVTEESCWFYYLPVNEIIPVIKDKLIKTTDEKDRIDLLMRMIYACNVNKDDNALYKTSCTKIEKMTIRDYPWLMDVIYEILRSGKNSILKNILQENEPELYCSWFPSNMANVTSGAALALLKRDSRNVLDNWEEYLANCMKNYNSKHVQRFIKATRWYKDLPIKFFERCMNYIYDKNTDEIPSSLVVLALLCHGDELTKLIDPFIPTETLIDINLPNAKNNYKIVKYLLLSMRLSNPPIPLDLIVRLCVGDYLSMALMTLTNADVFDSD
ncbi:PREDICTED: uncharacterized protein LOC108778233 [Cyphomyrmex costatus]|uniref:uncharacterized protein LOC108778233 n=1 Tax=Cyphomyrmex costatus TaxID=456900 RepID=UPI0008522F59|nr:PREDICTED: uncharacterized protein LOC108778233 [Cyphomyrmex costatus]